MESYIPVKKEEWERILEKITPKKAKESVCPNCDSDNSFITDNLAFPARHKVVYCWNCGQAMDWMED